MDLILNPCQQASMQQDACAHRLGAVEEGKLARLVGRKVHVQVASHKLAELSLRFGPGQGGKPDSSAIQPLLGLMSKEPSGLGTVWHGSTTLVACNTMCHSLSLWSRISGHVSAQLTWWAKSTYSSCKPSRWSPSSTTLRKTSTGRAGRGSAWIAPTTVRRIGSQLKPCGDADMLACRQMPPARCKSHTLSSMCRQGAGHDRA